jgi:transposase
MDDASPAITADLPDDPALLKRIILGLSRRCDEATRLCGQVTRERDQWHVKFLRAEVELLRYKKWYYGPKADQLATPGDVSQMLLSFAQQQEERPIDPQDLPSAVNADDPDQLKSVRRIKRGRGRRKLASFDQLPLVRHEHDLSDDQKPCPCCGKMRERIGQESSWQIEYIPGHFERIEHVCFKYACQDCDSEAFNPNIELAGKPTQPIEKGMAGPGLLAYVVTSKFSDYLPLYRLQAIFGRNGFEIDRGTLGIWCRDVAEIVKPVYDLMIQRILRSHVICTDDTPMPMLAPGHGKTKQARMWVYVGDGHNPYNLFDFTLSRSRDGPASFLGNYKQVLMADAYGGYDGVVVQSGIVRAGCWAHARRKFVDAEKVARQIAQQAVELIGRLYAVEEQAKLAHASDADRLELRRRHSVAVLGELHHRLWAWKDQLLPKHPMAEAVGYVLNQWAELNVFTSDGAVPIDNNISEREIKRIVLNRKNSLFVGNERGGQTAAILASLTSTCRRHGIDPQRYLTQLLTNLPDTPISRVSDWLPDAWKRAHPQEVPSAAAM